MNKIQKRSCLSLAYKSTRQKYVQALQVSRPRLILVYQYKFNLQCLLICYSYHLYGDIGEFMCTYKAYYLKANRMSKLL